MAGIGINKFHTWHISIAVTYINHVSKRNTNILGLKIIIDGEIIYIQCIIGKTKCERYKKRNAIIRV